MAMKWRCGNALSSFALSSLRKFYAFDGTRVSVFVKENIVSIK